MNNTEPLNTKDTDYKMATEKKRFKSICVQGFSLGDLHPQEKTLGENTQVTHGIYRKAVRSAQYHTYSLPF